MNIMNSLFQYTCNVCAVKPTIRDKNSWQTCLKRVLLSTISFIISLYLNAVNSPTSESMLFVDKERLEGLKYNIGFGGKGGGTQGKGIGMFNV